MVDMMRSTGLHRAALQVTVHNSSLQKYSTLSRILREALDLGPMAFDEGSGTEQPQKEFDEWADEVRRRSDLPEQWFYQESGESVIALWSQLQDEHVLHHLGAMIMVGQVKMNGTSDEERH